MSAVSDQFDSVLCQSLSDETSEQRIEHSAAIDDGSSYLYVASSRISDTTSEFEMLNHNSSTVTQIENNSCVMSLHNGCKKKEIIEKNERMNGNNKKISHLPKPKIVLYPPEQVQLGWRDKKMLVGSGLDNPGFICYINATLQVCVNNKLFTLHSPNALNLLLLFFNFRLCSVFLHL